MHDRVASAGVGAYMPEAGPRVPDPHRSLGGGATCYPGLPGALLLPAEPPLPGSALETLPACGYPVLVVPKAAKVPAGALRPGAVIVYNFCAVPTVLHVDASWLAAWRIVEGESWPT